MNTWIIKKTMLALFTVYVIASLNFVIFQVLSPVDPVDMIMDPRFTPELKNSLRHLYGLDKPIVYRYILYIRNMFTFQFGYSFSTHKPVANEILERLGNTLLLLGSSLIITILIGIPLGILAASRRKSKLDIFIIGSGLLTRAAPSFFIQLLSLLLFVNYLNWFPYGSITSIPPPKDPFTYMVDVIWHLFLPVSTLVLIGFGFWALYSRNLMLDTLTQDFILTARAKGVKERKVLYHHAFRAILPPVFTIIAMALPGLFTGAVLTEIIFAWPGMGWWLFQATMNYNYPVVQAVFFIYAILMVGVNYISDILYSFLDPRIRLGIRR